jgi:hypothetical protein
MSPGSRDKSHHCIQVLLAKALRTTRFGNGAEKFASARRVTKTGRDGGKKKVKEENEPLDDLEHNEDGRAGCCYQPLLKTNPEAADRTSRVKCIKPIIDSLKRRRCATRLDERSCEPLASSPEARRHWHASRLRAGTARHTWPGVCSLRRRGGRSVTAPAGAGPVHGASLSSARLPRGPRTRRASCPASQSARRTRPDDRIRCTYGFNVLLLYWAECEQETQDHALASVMI